MGREVLCTVNRDGGRESSTMIMYKDHTYKYLHWEEREVSKWRIRNDTLWVKHPEGTWTKCPTDPEAEFGIFHRKIIEEVELALSIDSMLR